MNKFVYLNVCCGFPTFSPMFSETMFLDPCRCFPETDVFHTAKESALGGSKTHAQVPTRYGGIWIVVCQGRWSLNNGLHRFKLDRQCRGQEKHLQVLFQLGIRGCLVVQQETKVSCMDLCESRVYSSQFGNMRNHMASEIAQWVIWSGDGSNYYPLRQLELY